MSEPDKCFELWHRTCPVCGKAFIVPPENAYKLYIDGKWVDFCRYSCFRSEQVTLPPKKYAVRAGRPKKRLQAEDTI